MPGPGAACSPRGREGINPRPVFKALQAKYQVSRSLQSMRKRSETRLQLESSRRYLDRLRDKLLAGGHNLFNMISPTAGQNLGRVKQSESVDRSIETSSITTGHNCTRAEQALLGHITSRQSGGHNSFNMISPTAGLDFGRVKQSESVDRSIGTSSITTGRNYTRVEQALLGHITSQLSSGHNSLGSISLTAGQNNGRVKQSKSVGRSPETSRITTGHNYTRAGHA